MRVRTAGPQLIYLVLSVLASSSVTGAKHCRPHPHASGSGGALAPGATGLVSGISHANSNATGTAQATVTRTVTVTRSAGGAHQTGGPDKGDSSATGAMVTVYYGKGKYPSVGPIHESHGHTAPTAGSASPSTSPVNTSTDGMMTILPYPMPGDGTPSPSPHSPSSGSPSASASATASGSQLPPYVKSALDHDTSGTPMAGKVTDRLPGGQGGVVVETRTTPTSPAGAWGPNPTLNTSTDGSLTYNR